MFAALLCQEGKLSKGTGFHVGSLLAPRSVLMVMHMVIKNVFRLQSLYTARALDHMLRASTGKGFGRFQLHPPMVAGCMHTATAAGPELPPPPVLGVPTDMGSSMMSWQYVLPQVQIWNRVLPHARHQPPRQWQHAAGPQAQWLVGALPVEQDRVQGLFLGRLRASRGLDSWLRLQMCLAVHLLCRTLSSSTTCPTSSRTTGRAWRG